MPVYCFLCAVGHWIRHCRILCFLLSFGLPGSSCYYLIRKCISDLLHKVRSFMWQSQLLWHNWEAWQCLRTFCKQFTFSSLFWKYRCIWLLYLNINHDITKFLHLQAMSVYNIQLVLKPEMLTLSKENFTCPALKNRKKLSMM